MPLLTRRVYYWGAPLAALAAVSILATLKVRQAPLGFNREGAIAAARSHLRAWGVDASTWRPLVKTEYRDEAYLLHRTTLVPAESLAARLAPPYVLLVSLTPPEGDESVETTLSPGGDLLLLKTPTALGLIRLPAKEALERWRRQLPAMAVEKSSAESVTFRDPAVAQLRYEATAKGGMTLESLELSVLVPDEIASAARIQERMGEVRKGISAFLLFFLILYAVRRYFKRRREQEAPKARALLLLILVCILGLAGLAASFDQAVQMKDFNTATIARLAATLVSGMIGTAIFGLLLAAAYGGGEGELREAYPGKLTSLDAVLSGRVLSHNVAISGFQGLAFAGWALLVLAAGLLVLRQPLEADFKELVSFLVSRYPWAALLLHVPMEVVMYLVVSLLIPLTFVRRNIGKRWLAVTVMLVFAWFSLAGVTSFGYVRPGTVWLASLSALTLLGAFWFHDVLAAIVALGAYRLAALALALANFDPAGVPIAAWSLALAAAVLFPLLFLAMRRPAVSEAEVSPTYARNLVQRLAMRREVSAAREAQLRLLPASAPAIPGLSWSAACHAAGEVGGDFYDYFPLSRGRVAVLMASGSGSGLASALLIGLAKGFLDCYLARHEDPVAALARLRQTLPEMIGSKVRVDLALLVIDPGAEMLAAARLGDYPLLWIESAAGVTSVELYTGPGDVATAQRRLGPGEQVILHSRGVVALMEDQSATGRSAWFQQLVKCARAESPEARLRSLLERLGSKKKNWARKLRLDVTVVVARLEQAATQGVEQVA